MAFPRASTTRPSSSSPTGTSTMAPVLFTMSPSLISLSLPNTTTPTLSGSKFRDMPWRIINMVSLKKKHNITELKLLAFFSFTILSVQQDKPTVHSSLTIFIYKRCAGWRETLCLWTYFQARGKFHHLFCLDIPQSIHSGNTVTNRQHTPCLLQVCRGVSSQDLLLQDGGHLGCACERQNVKK